MKKIIKYRGRLSTLLALSVFLSSLTPGFCNASAYDAIKKISPIIPLLIAAPVVMILLRKKPEPPKKSRMDYLKELLWKKKVKPKSKPKISFAVSVVASTCAKVFASVGECVAQGSKKTGQIIAGILKGFLPAAKAAAGKILGGVLFAAGIGIFLLVLAKVIMNMLERGNGGGNQGNSS